jgi:hypothetical protein
VKTGVGIECGSMGSLIGGAAIALISFMAGSYLRAYLTRKGENLATREDIANLVAQMSAVTQATKDIEAKVSNEVWDRQKRWELKRDVLFEATRKLADVEDGLLALEVVLQVEHKEPKKEDDLGWVESKHARMTKWTRASSEFDEARLLVLMVCEKETIQAFDQFGAFASIVAAKTTAGKDFLIYNNSQVELFKKRLAVRVAVRKELAIDKAKENPSNESSPTPTYG